METSYVLCLGSSEGLHCDYLHRLINLEEDGIHRTKFGIQT